MTTQKPITIIISDLHLGGGLADPGDDHVYQESEFCNFLAREIPESQDGDTELFVNGDFLEFAQVKQDSYTLGSPKYWCSENESMEKLGAIINGHKDIFEAMRDFKSKGNEITIAAGNHDIDLYWRRVQQGLQEAVGEINFDLGKEWFYRYDSRLAIAHGHMIDPANRFKNWEDPILQVPGEPPRLEMCPGTLFMVKFVNWLENQYPFADNVKPITSLARLLYKEKRGSFKTAVWTLLRFAGEHPPESLGFDETGPESAFKIGEQIVYKIQLNKSFANKIVKLYREMGIQDATLQTIRKDLKTERDVLNFLTELMVKVSPDLWMPVFDNISEPLVIGIDHDATNLSIINSFMMKHKENLKKKAMSHFFGQVREVVVCGHSHQPDEWRGPEGKWDGGYFNPGSWTRYVDISEMPKLTLEDLKREEDFPYKLNYIRVEESSTGILRADKVCYKYEDAKWSI